MLTSCLVFSLLVAAADPPKKDEKKVELSDAAKKELKKLEGKWLVVTTAQKGHEGDATEFGLYLTFNGSEVRSSNKRTGNNSVLAVTALDPTTDPPCIDLTELADAPGERPVTFEGVFKLDGDALRLAVAVDKGGKLRPTTFDRPTDARVMVWTLKRVKE